MRVTKHSSVLPYDSDSILIQTTTARVPAGPISVPGTQWLPSVGEAILQLDCLRVLWWLLAMVGLERGPSYLPEVQQGFRVSVAPERAPSSERAGK